MYGDYRDPFGISRREQIESGQLGIWRHVPTGGERGRQQREGGQGEKHLPSFSFHVREQTSVTPAGKGVHLHHAR